MKKAGVGFFLRYIVPIAPGDTIRFSNSLKYFGRAPTSVDLRFMDNIGMYSDDYIPYQSAFQISSISTSSSNDFYTVSGTVTNNSTEKQGIMISAIFAQKGEIIGGYFTYADPLDTGESELFYILAPRAFEGCDFICSYSKCILTSFLVHFYASFSTTQK